MTTEQIRFPLDPRAPKLEILEEQHLSLDELFNEVHAIANKYENHKLLVFIEKEKHNSSEPTYIAYSHQTGSVRAVSAKECLEMYKELVYNLNNPQEENRVIEEDEQDF